MTLPSCPAPVDLLLAFEEGDLLVREHVLGCATCSEILAAHAHLEQRLYQCEAPEVPDFLLAKVMRAIEDQPRKTSRELKEGLGILGLSLFAALTLWVSGQEALGSVATQWANSFSEGRVFSEALWCGARAFWNGATSSVALLTTCLLMASLLMMQRLLSPLSAKPRAIR